MYGVDATEACCACGRTGSQNTLVPSSSRSIKAAAQNSVVLDTVHEAEPTPLPSTPSPTPIPTAKSTPSPTVLPTPAAPRPRLRPCEDKYSDWMDTYGYRCSDYIDKSFCTAEGGYGPGWKSSWGSFDSYAVNGVAATEACCNCGGEDGALIVLSKPAIISQPTIIRAAKVEPIQEIMQPIPEVTPLPPTIPVPPTVTVSEPECQDIAGWKDSYDYTCDDYLDKSFCKSDKSFGAGWKATWGPFDAYSIDGIDATQACCTCGKGTDFSPPKLSKPRIPKIKETPAPIIQTPAPTIKGPCENKMDGWTDTYGYSCEDYVENDFCTLGGGFGMGWDAAWGNFAEYAMSGMDANEVCCDCGGGVAMVYLVGALPEPKVPCKDLEGWVDSFGYSCFDYSENAFCTLKKGYGTGWGDDWGAFSDYAMLGVDATSACCACGGEGMPEEPEIVEPAGLEVLSIVSVSQDVPAQEMELVANLPEPEETPDLSISTIAEELPSFLKAPAAYVLAKGEKIKQWEDQIKLAMVNNYQGGTAKDSARFSANTYTGPCLENCPTPKTLTSVEVEMSRLLMMSSAHIVPRYGEVVLAEDPGQFGFAVIPPELPLRLGFPAFHFNITFDLEVSIPDGCEGGGFIFNYARNSECAGGPFAHCEGIYGSFALVSNSHWDLHAGASFILDGVVLPITSVTPADFFDQKTTFTIEYKQETNQPNLRSVYFYADDVEKFHHQFYLSDEQLNRPLSKMEFAAVTSDCYQSFSISNLKFSTSKVLQKEDVSMIDFFIKEKSAQQVWSAFAQREAERKAQDAQTQAVVQNTLNSKTSQFMEFDRAELSKSKSSGEKMFMALAERASESTASRPFKISAPSTPEIKSRPPISSSKEVLAGDAMSAGNLRKQKLLMLLKSNEPNSAKDVWSEGNIFKHIALASGMFGGVALIVLALRGLIETNKSAQYIEL